MLCCASLRLRLRTLCAGSRSEALVGFVAEKLSQLVGDFQVNLFGTELLFLMGKNFCNSSFVNCVPVAEVRRLLDL